MSETEVPVNKDQLLKKIRALQQKTEDNGCSEAEALLAAKKVTELLDRYGFDHTDLLEKNENLIEHTFTETDGQLDFLRTIAPAVAEYCDIKTFLKGRAPELKIMLFGRESDVEVAKYLLTVFKHAIKREWNVYWVNYERTGARSEWYHVNKAFRSGMAIRLIERLQDMKRARNKHVDKETNKTGKALVEIKNAVVEAEFAKKYNLKQGRVRYYRTTTGFAAGYKAGDNVSIQGAVSHAKK